MEEIPFTDIADKDKDTKKILALYIVFILILAVQVLPQMNVQLLALLLLALLGGVIRFLRRESDKGSMMYNHTTYLSRTLWFWGFILAIGTGILFLYLSKTYDIDRMQALAQSMLQGDYHTPDMRQLMLTGALSMAPSFIYLILRVIRGLYYALKHKGVPNPKTLF